MFTDIKLLVLCFLLLTPLSNFANSDSSITNQTEAGFKITEAAARSVLSRADFKEKRRFDFYVDIYDGQNFLLDDGHFKLRLKVTDDVSTVQANTKQKILPSQCLQGWKYNILVKKIGELKIDQQKKQQFANAITTQLNLIEQGSPATVRNNILTFDQFIKTLQVPLLENLMAVPQHSKWFFVAGYQDEKTKWVSKVKLGKKEIEVSIGQARQYVGHTYIGSNFEIEFQFEKEEIALSEFQSFVCGYLKQNAFRDEDFVNDNVDPQQETLQRLKHYNSVLGL